jgi:hypothetical protein
VNPHLILAIAIVLVALGAVGWMWHLEGRISRRP